MKLSSVKGLQKKFRAFELEIDVFKRKNDEFINEFYYGKSKK